MLQLGPQAASSVPDIISGALVIYLLSRRPDGLASLFSRWQSPAGLTATGLKRVVRPDRAGAPTAQPAPSTTPATIQKPTQKPTKVML